MCSAQNTGLEKKYNVLDSVLQIILSKCITLSAAEKKLYNNKLYSVLQKVINKMREVDGDFNSLYRENMFTGSYYENLRINKPDEFDINLIFSLPIKFKIEYNSAVPGFVKLKFEDFKPINTSPNVEKLLRSWINSKQYFLRNSFRQWMQGVFDKALQELKDPEIKPSSSGPALTLKVMNPSFSVDLVPVLEFSKDDWSSLPIRLCPEGVTSTCWYTVPKAPEGVRKEEETYWRMSFYNQEKDLMNGLGGMKPIIKLLKLLRENKNWKFLSSYAIKTLFLWENEKNRKENLWKNGLGFLFVHMLTTLSESAGNNTIPFYWDENLNLLKTKTDTTSNMKNFLVRMIKKINQNLNNPSIILEYFGGAGTILDLQKLSKINEEDKSTQREFGLSGSTLDSRESMESTQAESCSWESSPDSRESRKSNLVHVERDKNINWPPIQSLMEASTDKCQRVLKYNNTMQEERKENYENLEAVEISASENDQISEHSKITLLDIINYQKESHKFLCENLEIISRKLDSLINEVKELQAENCFMRKIIGRLDNSSTDFTDNLIDLD